MRFAQLKWIASLLTALALLATTAAAKDIRIGMLLPLTGVNAGWGQEARIAADLAVEEINNQGGIHGNRLRLMHGDAPGDPRYAVSAASRMLSESVVAILGPMFSSEALAVSPIVAENRTPLITSSASDSRITRSNSWVFRTNLTDEQLLKKGISKWADRLDIRSAAIIFDKSSERIFTQSTIQIPRILDQRNIRLKAQISFGGRSAYFAEQVKEIMRARPHGVIIYAYPFQTANIVRELSEKGFRNPIYTVIDPSIDLAAKFVRADRTLFFATSSWVDPKNRRQKRFLKNFSKRFSGNRTEKFFAPIAAQTYDAINVIETILERSPASTIRQTERSRRTIREGWASLKNYQGVSGTFSIDRNGDADREVYLITVSNGRYQLAD
jgi:branched-chain amino acid transport system substrate-binding protein